jgi:hypothetical protein
MNDIDYIGANELVFNSDKEAGIYSGGFSVNSIMMKAGMSPIMTINTQTGTNTQTGGTNKVSDLFDSLVVPNWALSYSSKIGGGEYKEQHDEDSDDDIDDDLHDKLLDLVKEHEIKENQKKNKKTRRQKRNANVKKGGTKRRK